MAEDSEDMVLQDGDNSVDVNGDVDSKDDVDAADENANCADTEPAGVIPYTSVLAPPVSAARRRLFLPRGRVGVKVTGVDVAEDGGSGGGAILYEIEFTHGAFTWRVQRKWKHVQSVHTHLTLYKAKRTVYVKTFRLKENLDLPEFPSEPEAGIGDQQETQRRMALLEEYLGAVMNNTTYRKHHEVLKLCEVSHLSFVDQLGAKWMESLVTKRCGGDRSASCVSWIKQKTIDLKERWLVLKDTFVAYVDPASGETRNVLLMDRAFRTEYLMEGGEPAGVSITNLTRSLQVPGMSRRGAEQWKRQLESAAATTGAGFVQENRCGSFAPVRNNTPAKWYIDAADYMSDVADALERAREQILITDWWLSPELYLRRPFPKHADARLDLILQRKALEGVRVFVLLWKEVSMAVGINSFHTKQVLVSLSDNIKVLRDPDQLTLYSHHEKLVVVDQEVAFMGGVDLCYGRWDNAQHSLSEFPSQSVTSPAPDGARPRFPVAMHYFDAANEEVDSGGGDEQAEGGDAAAEDMVDGADTLVEEAGETEDAVDAPNLAAGAEEEAEVAVVENAMEVSSCEEIERQLAAAAATGGGLPRGFLEFLNDVKQETYGTDEESADKAVRAEAVLSVHAGMDIPLARSEGSGEPAAAEPEDPATASSQAAIDSFLQSMGTMPNTAAKPSTPPPRNKFKKTFNKFTSRIFPSSENVKEEAKTEDDVDNTVGEDVERAEAVQNVENYQQPEDDVDFINNKKFTGVDETDLDASSSKYWIGKDYVNFIFKDFVDLDKPFQDLVDRSAVPRMPWHDIAASVHGAAARDLARHFIQRWNVLKYNKARDNQDYPMLLPKAYTELTVPDSVMEDPRVDKFNVQVLRSSSQWSAGLSQTENSIYQAYLDCIDNAQHYIYIENQFFVSNSPVKNKIAEHIVRRINRAHIRGERFRVYVMLPLLPAFEGQIGTSTGSAIQAVTYWNYHSIARGAGAILRQLALSTGMKPFDYISFYCVRNYGAVGDNLMSELIYVHSKLLIVDDRRVIIGSANINDRSLLGDRDSELAVLVEDDLDDDSQVVMTTMDGEEYRAGKYAHGIRTTLFKEHLGVAGDDPAIDVTDPVADAFYHDVWMKHARVNTETFEKVFNCIPSDSARTYTQLDAMRAQPVLAQRQPRSALQLLQKHVQGHVVLFPLYFLCEEDLKPRVMGRDGLSKEGIVPMEVWT